MGRKRLIYVKEQSGPRSILDQMFEDLQGEWETFLADSLQTAAKLMRKKSFDALVLDADQANPERVEFLKETAVRAPKTHCFVLTRAEDPNVMESWSGAAAE